MSYKVPNGMNKHLSEDRKNCILPATTPSEELIKFTYIGKKRHNSMHNDLDNKNSYRNQLDSTMKQKEFQFYKQLTLVRWAR